MSRRPVTWKILGNLRIFSCKIKNLEVMVVKSSIATCVVKLSKISEGRMQLLHGCERCEANPVVRTARSGTDKCNFGSNYGTTRESDILYCISHDS